MSSHWFDRLARVRAASPRVGIGEDGELTRRDALTRAGVATLGLSSLGALGVAAPATAAATRRVEIRRRDSQLATCGKCNKESAAKPNRYEYNAALEFFKYAAATPAFGFGGVLMLLKVAGAEAARFSNLKECARGACNPQSYQPGPSATPATDVETGAPSCPPGTRDCGEAPGTGSHYCCFGNDACCNGTCCIAEVGCACAPG